MKKPIKLTLISDTHAKHLGLELEGGDLLIHAGDVTNREELSDLKDFCEWFDRQNYDKKIFIAGNHDFCFQNNLKKSLEIINKYPSIIYLQDEEYIYEGIKIYGSPWQPEFNNWAFNLPRKGDELKAKWAAIPKDTNILITHGPPYGYFDTVEYKRNNHLGCELLRLKVDTMKNLLHVFGHIHTGRTYPDGILGIPSLIAKDANFYVNASVLNEQYDFSEAQPIINMGYILKPKK